MIDQRIVNFLKNKSWWFDDESEEYKSAILDIGLELEDDISKFFLHAEDGPTFLSKKIEMFQICWFQINSDYQGIVKASRNAYGISDDFIPLNDFSYGAYFYNVKEKNVIFLDFGETLERFKEGEKPLSWNDFNSFLLWFFNIEDK